MIDVDLTSQYSWFSNIPPQIETTHDEQIDSEAKCMVQLKDDTVKNN